MPSRSPGRVPPYGKSRVLRPQVLGDEDDGGSHDRNGDEPDWAGPTASEGARVMPFDWPTALVSLTLS